MFKTIIVYYAQNCLKKLNKMTKLYKTLSYFFKKNNNFRVIAATKKREGTETHPLLLYLIIRADNIRPYDERYLILREGTETLPYNERYWYFVGAIHELPVYYHHNKNPIFFIALFSVR